MKKLGIMRTPIKYVVLCLLSLALVVAFSGCTSESGPTKTEKDWPTVVSWGSATAGGTYHTMSAAMSSLIEEYIPGVKCSAEITGGSAENIKLMEAGEVDFGVINPFDAYYAIRAMEVPGVIKYEKNYKPWAMWTGHTQVYHIFVDAESDIYSVADLKGKRFAFVKAKPSPISEMALVTMFKVYGIDAYNDVVDAATISVRSQCDALKEGAIDATYYPGRHRTAVFIDLSETHDCRLLNIEQDKLDMILDENPFLFDYTIPAGTYRLQDEEVHGMGAGTIMACRGSLPDDFIYEVCAAVLDHPEELQAMQPALAGEYIKESIGINTVLPFHPGAVKYFKDRGVWTKELEEQQESLIKELGW